MAAVLGAAASLAGLGLVMGFSPTVYAYVIHLLATSRSAGASVRWITLGLSIGSTVLLLVFRAVDPDTIMTVVRDDAEGLLVRRSVDLVAGSLFVLAGIVVAVLLRRSGKGPARSPRRPHPRSHTRGPMNMVVFGIVNAMVGVSGMATMYVAGRVITAATHGLAVQAILFCVFLAALASQYLLVAWAWSRLPHTAQRISALLARLAQVDTRPWLAA